MFIFSISKDNPVCEFPCRTPTQLCVCCGGGGGRLVCGLSALNPVSRQKYLDHPAVYSYNSPSLSGSNTRKVRTRLLESEK